VEESRGERKQYDANSNINEKVMKSERKKRLETAGKPRSPCLEYRAFFHLIGERSLIGGY
jgi:hypothetical protein